MLFYIYSDAPSSTIDITSRCRVGRLSVKDNAEEGSVAISNLIVDDPDGDLELTGHRRIYIYESDAPILDQVVFNGFVVNERVERGPYRTGPGRQWVVDLADPDVFINRRIMNGADANRPAETDLARIQALLTMTELNTVDDDTYVSTTAATTAMDACDYRGQNVGAYIDDCRQASGKNGYILYNETVGQYGLWYDFASSSAYSSNCFLTNTVGDNNEVTTFLYSQERTYLNRDPSRVASGIYLQYDGGTVYVQDSGTTAEFAAIDWAAPSINVKSLTKATARANRYLADASTEHNIIHTVMTKVPRSKVNEIKKGQLVSFKSEYMPGFTSYTLCRVLYRTVTEISEDPLASFEIEMDLDPAPSTDICIEGNCRGFNVNYDVTIPECVQDGDMIVAVFSARGSPAGSSVLGPEVWTLAASVDAERGDQYPGPGPATVMDVWYRTWNTGDSTTLNVQPNHTGSRCDAIVIPAATATGAPTVTSYGPVDAYVSRGALSIGPTAGGGTFLTAVAIQRNDANQQLPGFAIEATGDTVTVAPAGTVFDSDCATWSPRRWIGMVQGTGALTITGTVVQPGPDEDRWGWAWVGLYWA